ncbi:APC family permease [Mesoplasma coleopterae]|uniref:Amino acid/amine (Lysine) APC transporter n=1 Tax=Mesoplasma coleopterae TaxID=324078 RepID=A0A2K8P4R8_9MOLU|nr:amino acid permease [Mesoplasma coleopterae]ATZ21140.1 amino acid/amine (lysine) APC transporter [Mesoplasma coleopterae]AVN62618.1 amino acid/amine (lysine) APC transporter [Mesoplasma coleopterae]AVN63299.1 amino acid/amine (lysine) APC transporter [Mesoplasma coleopterae]
MKLNRKYGFWTVLASTLAAIVGSSIIISFNMVFALAQANPLLMILAWVFGALIVLPDAFIVIEPSIGYGESGSGYSWIRKCNWRILAFWFGWVLILFVSATSLASCCSAMSSMITQILELDSKDFAVESLQKALAVFILVSLAGIQIMVKNSSKYTQIFFLFVKTLPIILVFILAIMYGSKEGLLSNSQMNSNLGHAYISSAMLIPAITYTGFAYSGHEFPTYITEEIENPKKTVPLVIISAVLIVLVIYVCYGIALLSLATPDSQGNWIDPNGTTSTIFAQHKWAVLTFNIFAIFLFVGSVNSLLFFQSRLIHKLSETGDVHTFFGKVHKKTNQPYTAIILLGCVAVFYILFSSISEIISSFALATSTLKILLNSAIIKLRLKDPEYKKIYGNKTFWILMILSLATCALTFIGSIYLMVIMPHQQTGASTFSILWKPILMVIIAFLVYLFGIFKFNNIKIK